MAIGVGGAKGEGGAAGEVSVVGNLGEVCAVGNGGEVRAVGATGGADEADAADEVGAVGEPGAVGERGAVGEPGAVDAALSELGERIALLAAQISAATYELLMMLREFDEGGGWNSGFRSCAHWLVWRVGLDLGAAREKVRVARALGGLPAVAESMRRGEVSYSKVRALTRIATPANEAELLGFARAGTAAHVEKLVRGMRRVDRLTHGEQAARHRAARYLHTRSDEDGMVVISARLAPEAAAAVLCALDAGVEKLYGPHGSDGAEGRRAGGLSADGGAVPVEEITFEQRRADALVLVAESALAGGLDPGTRGDRYQVVVHVDAEALGAGGEGGATCLDDGAHVSAETCRRLGCEAAVVGMRHGADGSVLAVGRRRRAISPGLRRALGHRDRGCRFPGCGARLCDAHHVRHWADGGRTELANTVLLCRFHHRAVHEGGFSMELGAGGEARFYRPDGRALPVAPLLVLSAAPSMPTLPAAPLKLALPGDSDGPAEALTLRLASGGVVVDARESMPGWWGGSVDYAWEIEWLLDVEARAAAEADSEGELGAN